MSLTRGRDQVSGWQVAGGQVAGGQVAESRCQAGAWRTNHSDFLNPKPDYRCAS